MSIENLNEQNKELLKALLEEFSSNYFEVNVISVCTSDGFDLHFISKKDTNLEADKVSAIASTLCSLSNASSEQISNSRLELTTIESENGCNILLMKTFFSEIDCVICAEASDKMSLAELRFITNALSKKIKAL